ncbi:hypothetical protein RIR_jg15077.t1 [Rhizophagus irregularis DAOM 181602=DAOM 197198]|nr:hypothetical protein RIR_jg15077.t1 [Rhizophagus irregularis DAOM 181602=DAOM 197198]
MLSETILYMEQKEHQFFGYLNFLPAFKHGTIERRKYQVWTCKLRINAYLLEFWMSEAPVSGHGRLKSNISSINSIDPIDPYRLIFFKSN